MPAPYSQPRHPHCPSFISPKLEVRPNPAKGGYGLFAAEPIQPDELLLVWGGGIFTYEAYLQVPESRRAHFVQVEEDLYLGNPDEPEAGDYINHSCSPNAGLHGQIAVVAIGAIQPGAEICFDYAMSDGSPYDEFECGCGAPDCRGRVTGEDWKRADLQQRYAGYFSPYLQRRIERMRQG
jgi:SET domain-containing protein